MNKYKITYQRNSKKLIKIIDTEGYLDKSLLPKNVISIKKLNKKITVFKDEIVINILNELNLILYSNINFNEALDIIKNSRKDKESLQFLGLIYKIVIEQESVDEVFNKIKINKTVKLFFKLISNSGEINSNLSALNIVLTQEKELKEKFQKKLSYPIFLFLSFLSSLIIIFLSVIPKFKTLIKEDNSSIATKSIFFAEYIFSNYMVYIILLLMGIVLIIVFLLKKNRKIIDMYLVKFIPFYKYYELYKLFMVIELFVKGKYEFYLAFSNSSYLIKNKYLLDKISLCNSLLHKGKSIAFSFNKAEIFDEIVVNLMNIAQQTNSVDTISSDIKNIYKQKFDRSFDIFIGTIQPIFLIFMTFLILWIVMGIFIPLWDVSNIISL